MKNKEEIYRMFYDFLGYDIREDLEEEDIVNNIEEVIKCIRVKLDSISKRIDDLERKLDDEVELCIKIKKNK